MGFERGYFYSVLRKDSAEGGGDDVFTGLRACALDHEGFGVVVPLALFLAFWVVVGLFVFGGLVVG